jgi:cytochrome d ubiquinol oxidase subunit I
VASAFGLAASLSVVVLGDQSGYALTDNQKMKLAALEAMWRTEPAPAGLTLVGIPSMQDRQTHYGVHVPWVMGLIATRTVNKPVEGIFELVATAETRIESGVIAYDALQKVKADPADPVARGVFELHRRDLGYALLLKRHVADPRQASPQLIQQTAWETVPNVPVLFWSFRVMAGIGMFMIALFGTAFVLCTMRKHDTKWFLRIAVLALPLPWVAIEFGWILAEFGRQPWSVDGVLPTFLGASSLTVPQLWATIVGFTLLYGSLAVVEVRLMLHAIRKGPFHEQETFGEPTPEAPDTRPLAPAVA